MKVTKNFLRNSKFDKNVIAFVCTSLDNVAGGLERQLVRVSNELYRKGFNIIIFSYDNIPANSFYEIDNGINWVKCGNGLKPHSSANFLKRLKQIFLFRKEIKKYKVTHLITFHHGLFPRSLLASIFLSTKKIISERNSLENYKYIRLNKFNIGYLSLFFADLITVQLENYKNDYPKYLRKKIRVVPNILNKKSIYKEPLLNKKVVSMIGRLCPQKNFAPLLDQCLERIQEIKNLKIKIAGEGEYIKLFEKKYKNLINLDILELKGNIKDTNQFLMSSSIFCLPSLWEGYPNALVEALEAGLPIIISKRLFNLNEFVREDFNGKFVEDKDFLNFIIKFLKDENKLKIMSKNSFKMYQNLCDKSTINNWINLLN